MIPTVTEKTGRNLEEGWIKKLISKIGATIT
jgi:hypothetical protein